jgi:monoamine oxidase
MSALNRRSFVAGSAAFAAAAAVPGDATAAVRAAAGEPDIIVVGAGAAGIAAARRITAAGRRCVLVEAADRVGGRCVTDTATFGVPFDRGAHFIHSPDVNPLAKLAPRAGFEIRASSSGQRLRVGRRNAREGEMEDYLAAVVRASHAIGDAARKGEMASAQALPRDLGDWRSTVEFTLGPYGCGKDLTEVSAVDFAKEAERDVDAVCPRGLGALLAKLAEGLPLVLSAPVTRIEHGRLVEVQAGKTYLRARAAIVTASTNVLAAGGIRFEPELPRRVLDALGRLKLGSYDHVALELPGNPLDLQRDELVFEKSTGKRTAALLANVNGSSLCIVDVAGSFGRELAAQGEAAMVAFALDWLTSLYGADLRKAVKRTAATRWNEAPFALGAFSSASPGGQPARRVLMEPLRNRIWFAGEAVHETQWGTVGGAWESGERTAEAVLRSMGVLREETPTGSSRHPRRR